MENNIVPSPNKSVKKYQHTNGSLNFAELWLSMLGSGFHDSILHSFKELPPASQTHFEFGAIPFPCDLWPGSWDDEGREWCPYRSHGRSDKSDGMHFGLMVSASNHTSLITIRRASQNRKYIPKTWGIGWCFWYVQPALRRQGIHSAHGIVATGYCDMCLVTLPDIFTCPHIQSCCAICIPYNLFVILFQTLV